ncbi:MAG: aryl-sulfate sulfotransferase [Flavobacteriales bacterium]|nr:aryl-sulfate sulfotransferase [Flavobacteriales bacterium]
MRNFSLLFFVFGISIGQAQTIGLLEYSPGNLDGYVLFAPIPSTTTYLIDKCGREVHAWPSAYKPGQSVYMLDNGSLIRPASIPNNVFTAGGKAGAVERISWDGVLEWSYQVSDTGQCSHHDVYPMPNGHVLVLAWEKVSVAEALAQGRDPALLTNSLWPEKILELEPIGENQANIVWEWHTWDHLVQEFDDTKPNFAPTSEHPELVDLNYGNGMAQADWIHANALDYNADLDQIMISAHNFDELWVIDHSTTTAEAASHSGGTQGHGGICFTVGEIRKPTGVERKRTSAFSASITPSGSGPGYRALVRFWSSTTGLAGRVVSIPRLTYSKHRLMGMAVIRSVWVFLLLPQHWISNGRNRFRRICSPSAFPVHSSCRTEDYLFVMALPDLFSSWEPTMRKCGGTSRP